MVFTLRVTIADGAGAEKIGFVRVDGIPSAPKERIASEDAEPSLHEADDQPAATNRVDGVGGAGGSVAATRRQPGRDPSSIEPDDSDDPGGRPET